MWLTRLALRNPILILMMSLMTIVLGIVSLRRLSVDLFPNINIPVIRVATFYPGAGPADIEKSVTEPIERAVGAAPGVDRIESTSKQGASVVSVWFNYDVNLDNAQFEVQQRVAQILNTLPPGIQQPFILKFDITNIPVAQIAMTADGLDERQIYDLAFNVVEPQIERIQGVASATVGGGKIREIEVMTHRDALRARGLGLLDVVNAVKSSSLLLPSGNLRAGDRDYNLFSNTQVTTARSLNEVIVAPGAAGKPPVRLSDIAETEDATADQANIVRINGQRGVYLRVVKQPGSNTIAVVDSLRAALPNLRGVPPNVKLAISFDQSTYIRASVSALEHEALQGGLLAVVVILIFLTSVRATGIVAVAIPLSIVATFILLYFSGQTLNVFTLGGLALGVGRLVDDSIVELENIHRHLEHTSDRRKAVLDAAQEVAMPILVSTITTIVVFFPVLFLAGVARSVFFPLAVTISFALIVSFFVSRTVTPLLCLYGLKHGEEGVLQRWIRRRLDALDDAYAWVLTRVLRQRALTVLGIGMLFAGSLLLFKKIGTEFFPETDESQVSVVFKAPIGTRVERSEGTAKKIEAAIERTFAKQSGERESFASTVISDIGLPSGRTALFTANTGPHVGTVQINLVGKDARPFSDVAAMGKLRESLKDELPGVLAFYSSGGIVKRILNFGSAAPIDVEILGYDLEEGAAYAKRLQGALRDLKGPDGGPLLTDVQISREENYPELRVNVDREKAGVLGLSEQQIAQSVLTSLVGSTQITPMQLNDPKTGNAYNINVRLADAFRDGIDDLSAIPLKSTSGGVVTLDTVASIERSSGPVLITRKYLQRIVDVTANVAPDKDLGSATDAVQKAIDDTRAPEGFSVQLGGQSLAQQQAFAGLGFAAMLAIVLVYMVLASQFKSLIDPLVIMFSVPLGVSGVFVMLYATGTTLSVNSFMGIIMMVGIVVSNGVLLIDFANVLRRQGKELFEATIEAGRTRLRPILMTTIATIVGLIPMALGIGEGSESNLPLARAVIGGLTVSTFFTLFLVPALYTAMDRFARRADYEDD
ncbi:MAG: efflux RND transporter permease subunit [Polyangiaceae bacterium]